MGAGWAAEPEMEQFSHNAYCACAARTLLLAKLCTCGFDPLNDDSLSGELSSVLITIQKFLHLIRILYMLVERR
jgi:hypothetical protein